MKASEIVKTVMEFVMKGLAEFLSEIAMGSSVLIFNLVILKRMGDSGIATYSIICYVTTFVIMTMVGFNQGVQLLLSF